MKNIHLKIAGVSERDTDLLLLEEFMASPEFVDFFLKKIRLSSDELTFFEASRSVTDSTGESDLEIVLKNKDDLKFVLMLENKVNVGFQPKQAERYRERGTNYVKQGKIGGFTTVLVAPERYFSGNKKGFDHRVNYEMLRGWFEKSMLQPGRKDYKISVLTSAIEKSSSGYQMVADASVSAYWRDYWLLTLDIAPEFCMVEPPNKPARSTFIYFDKADLPQGVDLVHKLTHGFFDLQFSGMGDKLHEMRSHYQDKLSSRMKIERTQKSASIRISVPKISVADALEQQKEITISAIESGKALLRWCKANVKY